MTQNEHKRQRKLLAKRIQRKSAGQRKLARLRLTGIHARMESAASWPVVQARASTTIWKDGIGEALLARRGPNGMTVISVFLLDVYCLGVKNVISRADSELATNQWMSDLFDRAGPWTDVSPEYIRKVVEESIGYALSLGIAPHPECATAQMIFGDLDSSKCAHQFTFGNEGKPLFVAGPRDNPSRIRTIISTLQQTCGEDGFHYVLPMDSVDVPFGIENLADPSTVNRIEFEDDEE